MGGGAAARFPQAAAAVAARDRARRGRDHVRAAVADRRDVDDGVDRGAPDPDRARGRLRDPVPVASGRGAARRRDAGRRRTRRRGRRARDRGRGAGDGDRLPGAPALASADGPGFGLLLVVGIAVALGVRADGGLGRDGALRPRRRRARRVAARRRARSSGRRSSASAAPGRSSATAGPRHPTGSRCGRRACSARRWRAQARVLGRVGAPAGCPRLGRGHPDGRPVRRHQARAVEHAGAPQPQDAREGHGRLRRDRRHCPRRERRDAADGGLDDPLRASTARALGYLETKGCAHATLCPALSLPDLFLRRHRQRELRRLADDLVDQRLVERGSDVFLAGGHHPGSTLGDAGVRDPSDAAIASATRDQLHALAAASAARRDRAARGTAGARGTGERRPVVLGPPPADAPRRTGRGGARVARGVPTAAPGARAAGSDSARDGLVGADRVRDRIPLNPMSATLGRARDRDFDRVQRASLRALPAGARGRLRPADGADADLPVDGHGGARLGDHRDRRLRSARLLEHHDAPRFRLRDADRPVGVAGRGAAGAAGGARVSPAAAGSVGGLFHRRAVPLPRLRRRARVA